jgi:hypothetical protein
MWIVGVRLRSRHIPSFVRIAKRNPGIRRESHTSTKSWYRAPRSGYTTTILLAIPLVAAIYGFYSRRSHFRAGGANEDLEAASPVWRNIADGEGDADVGGKGEVRDGVMEDAGEVEVEEMNEEEEEEEPIEDFTTYPPPAYGRQFWISSRTTEEELSHYSQIFQVDIPCGIARYDVSALPR